MTSKKKSIGKIETQKISDSAMINENYFVGLLWAEPDVNYTEYQSIIEPEHLIHEVWRFYYQLGKQMYLDGVKKFDPITIQMKVKEYGIETQFDKFGGLDTIDDSVSLVKANSENIEYYAEEVQRNYIIRQLYSTFGEKIFVPKGKYNYSKLNKEQLVKYWQDKVNQISLMTMGNSQVENLIIDSDEFIKNLKEDASNMLPFYKSNMLNSITQGMAQGHVMMIGSFGNMGKTSFIAEKIVMSYIVNKEKAIVVLNEESANDFRQKIVISILNHELQGVKGFDRKRLVNGKLTPEDEEKIHMAFDKMKELTEGDDAQIKVVFMDQYDIDELENIVRYHANRGYDNLLIDTHKVSDNSKHDQRWVSFVEDAKQIYRFTRKEAGGANIRTVLTFQLADSHIRDRFLTANAMSEGKASKNEASVVLMFRPIFSDEYEGGKHELKVHKWRPKTEDEKILNPKDTKPYVKEEFGLEKGKIYYLLFTPKNRFGNNTDNGQEVLVLEPNFNFNTFQEVGWTYVDKDFN